MDQGDARPSGAIRTITKQLSDADVALFGLVMGAIERDDEPSDASERPARHIAPPAYLAALLTTVVAAHADTPDAAHVSIRHLRGLEPAYTDDTLTATAEHVGRDAGARAAVLRAWCDDQDGRRLAEGEFLLHDA